MKSPVLPSPEDVLRAEAFSAEHLALHARQIAAAHEIVRNPRKDRKFAARFAHNAELLKAAYGEISSAVRQGEAVNTEAEWLLDNYYIVEEQLREIRDDLPQKYYWELPKLASGEPRVYAVALELVLHTDSALDEETLVRFLQEYQSVAPLSIGEVWAVPIMLRLVLVENLRRVAAQMIVARRCRQEARRIWAAWQPHRPLPLDLSSLHTCAGIVLHLIEQIHQGGVASASASALQQLERQLEQAQLSAHDVAHHEHRRQAANQVSIGNIITSMRLITSLDWVHFFERTNPAEQVLRKDPAGIYPQMDFDSRNRYRDTIEQLAKRTSFSDLEVANFALRHAQYADNAGQSPRERHVGYWLTDRGREQLEPELHYRPPLSLRWRRWLQRHPAAAYFGCIGAWTVFLLSIVLYLTIGSPWTKLLIGLTAALPVLDLAISLTNLLVTMWLPPRLLSKLELKQGVPESCAAYVVVPSLLSSRREVQSLLERLELHYLANPEPTIQFALLTDFVDAPQEHLPSDRELLAQAVAGIRQLNLRYGEEGIQPFSLFHRERRWNAEEQCWMGWERKRGKLMEFNRFLAGAADTSFVVQKGAQEMRQRAAPPFVLTLDADTQLPFGAARKLIGTLAHPLNRPRVDPKSGRILEGYAVLQPKVGVHLGSANQTWFSRLYANHPGIDPYSTASSDVYQDLFGEGSFIGKGIYDLRAFDDSLVGRFPDNCILSHDLIEGCHARVGLVSDIELIDAFPARYESDARRQHRWVRGDWQLLPWLLPRVPTKQGWQRNPLSLLSRWKIIDNLRRSLLPPALFCWFLSGWLLWPSLAWLTTAVGLIVLSFPLLTQVVLAIGNWPREGSWRLNGFRIASELGRSLAVTVLSVAFLPHQAVLMLDAIGRTLWRLCISRRRMLEWETAAAAERRLSSSRWSALWHLWYVPLVALAVFLFASGEARWTAWPIAGLWLMAPLLAHWISLPIKSRTKSLSSQEQNWLRNVARRTWAFFEVHVGAEDHWLPPDNLQEYPQERIAHRVSPTNAGMYWTAALVAHDFGWLSLTAAADLWQRSWQNWMHLDRLHGHFYNWYDTVSLQPLFPRYVSTVDSGNLAACLLTLRQGIVELRSEPILGPQLWQGLQDTVAMAREAIDSLHPRGARLVETPLNALGEAVERVAAHSRQQPAGPIAWQALINQLQSDSDELRRCLEAFRASRQFPATDVAMKVECLLRWIMGVQDDCRSLLPWTEFAVPPDFCSEASHGTRELWGQLQQLFQEHASLAGTISVGDAARPILADLRQQVAAEFSGERLAAAHDALDDLSESLEMSRKSALALDARLERLAVEMEQAALEMDFRFLYNPARRLFSIGFNLEEEKLDRSHYDMLCSEARLASYLAIAKGDAEPRHWFQLGRQLTQTAGQAALLSWGGTMFEYLMPPLFQRHYDGSLLSQSCRAAVLRQQEYARQHGVPWGISESAFGALAVNSDYHYRSFGVPGLGLKRGLGEDLVISPYSTMLALEADPPAALANLQHLAREGAAGPWGFYDAIDYTPQRLPAGRRSIIVRCCMSHHQGMSLVAMANILLGGSIRRRFLSHPLARSTDLLLQERVPVAAPLVEPHAGEAATVEAPLQSEELVSRRLLGVETQTPRTHLLANGQYSVMITNSGGGYSRWRDVAVTRWRADSTCDQWGQFIYLRDTSSGQVWSATYQPTCVLPDEYEVIYSIDKAEYLRRDGDLDTLLEVTVSPENNAEVRQLTLTNHGPAPRKIEVTSYAEVVLCSPAADIAHPAFQKLFIETEYIPEESALVAHRRPRESRQQPLWAVHVLSGDAAGQTQFESSRAAFLGRGRSPHRPAALDLDVRLSGQSGAVLDPVFALQTVVTIEPRASVTLGLTTALATSREEALALADQYHEIRNVARAFELAWAYHQVQLRHQHLSPAKAHLYQRIAAAALYPDRSRRGASKLLLGNRLGQSGLWRHGISGDLPIVLIHVTEPEHTSHVRELLAAHAFWTSQGLAVDVVILNDYPGSYLDALQEQLVALLNEGLRMPDQPGSLFLLRGAQLAAEDKMLLEAVAVVVFHGDRGTIENQWDAAPPPCPNMPPPLLSAGARKRHVTSRSRDQIAVPARGPRAAPSFEFWNGTGGFAEGGREYRILLSARNSTPQPWSNVIANPSFGTLVTESGGGYTWFANSRENKLTSWSNDPVSDPPCEALYLRDEATGRIWSPFAGIMRDGGDYWIHHGQGYSRLIHHTGGIEHEVEISIAPHDPVKFIRVRLANAGAEVRDVSLTYYAELVLGVSREQTHLHVQTEFDAATGALLARNPYHPEFAGQVAFLHVLADTRTYTGDRTEFIGRNRDVQRPQVLERAHLSGTTGPGLDPCAAVQTKLRLDAGASTTVVFLLGAGESLEQAQKVLAKYSSTAAIETACSESAQQWERILGAIQIKTPNRALDLLVNYWLLYQTLSCRMWGRTGFYQAGGAYGFRDQLQDSMALVYSRPELTREHLLRAAARQFVEGDVQHWWHPPAGRGTRTRFSDDLLWLPFATAHYVRATGDMAVLDEPVPYLGSPPLAAHEQERYELPAASSEKGTLYDHCRRAIARGFTAGPHGLPLIGCGDWNDGFNRVGEGGRGESVWVGWFLLALLREFVPLMRARGDAEHADALETKAAALRNSLEQTAWDGKWYRRAYFDDGTPLGSAQNGECRIDSLAQTWAVLAGASPERTATAIQAVLEQLVRRDDGLVLLFTPPFDRAPFDPGYIKGYLPGIRENGGQYTHAAAWLIQALAQLGQQDEALSIFDLVNPIRKAANEAQVATYQTEPYAVAADIYSAASHLGRGGWTWYTGSAAWLYRVALESLLGLELKDSRLQLCPRLPTNWPGFELTYRYRQTTLRFVVARDATADQSGIDMKLPSDGREHEIRVVAR